ncbi:MAG: hypothetical protein SFT93_00655 [Rickettsiaceae bacterium]|nr:hypothetical protein [Rickettsiaceae bacterium]
MSEDYKKIKLTGNVFLKYEEPISKILQGDLRLLLNNDPRASSLMPYDNMGISGYLKAQVFDGKFWQFINLEEFIFNRENRFGKKQLPRDAAKLCAELLKAEVKNVEIYRVYRGHYTRILYEKNERITKHTKRK